MYLNLYMGEMLLFVIVFAFIIGVILYREFVNHSQPLKKEDKKTTSLTNEINDVLDQFEYWLQIANTKEALNDLLININDFTVNVFGNQIHSNITKDEFNRMSIDQVKEFISQLLTQIRVDAVDCSNQKSIRVVDHQ